MQYIDKIQPEAIKTSLYGLFVHQCIERYIHQLKSNYNNKGSLDIMRDSYNVLKQNFDLTSDEYNKAVVILEQICDYYNKQNVQNILASEYSFSYSLGRFCLVGRIDLIYQRKFNILEVIDFKVGKSYSDMQLQIYKYVLLYSNNSFRQRKINICYFLISDTFEKCYVDYNEKKVVNYVNIMYNKIMNEREWKRNESPLCSFCGFRKYCVGEINW